MQWQPNKSWRPQSTPIGRALTIAGGNNQYPLVADYIVKDQGWYYEGGIISQFDKHTLLSNLLPRPRLYLSLPPLPCMTLSLHVSGIIVYIIETDPLLTIFNKALTKCFTDIYML